MIQTYKFLGENSLLEFDDSKTVKELLQYAFEQFDYYEPFGMDAITIYQTDFAHFTLDMNIPVSVSIQSGDKETD